MSVRVLSFHAPYGCRDSGVCCSSAWPIPVERDRIAPLQNAWHQGRLGHASTNPLHFTADAPPDAPATLAVIVGHCVFYDKAPGHHCRVQRALGHEALPLACRQFPRVTVSTPAGVSVTLSHYCPTAAALLDDDSPVSILSDAAAFPPDAEYVGLDARESLPPLLRPDVLMDWSAWLFWEEASVDLLANSGAPPETALNQLHVAVERVRAWRPGDGSLSDAVLEAVRVARQEQTPRRLDWPQLAAEVKEAIPPEMRSQPRHDSRRSCQDDAASPSPVTKRFLAAHAFANWTAHLGGGLRSWLRSVEAAYALLHDGYDPGGADLILRHLADTDTLARTWSRAER